ncbi:hypothetical protein BH11PLA1_BH11PLA1_00550 [soil metagenome]
MPDSPTPNPRANPYALHAAAPSQRPAPPSAPPPLALAPLATPSPLAPATPDSARRPAAIILAAIASLLIAYSLIAALTLLLAPTHTRFPAVEHLMNADADAAPRAIGFFLGHNLLILIAALLLILTLKFGLRRSALILLPIALLTLGLNIAADLRPTTFRLSDNPGSATSLDQANRLVDDLGNALETARANIKSAGHPSSAGPPVPARAPDASATSPAPAFDPAASHGEFAPLYKFTADNIAAATTAAAKYQQDIAALHLEQILTPSQLTFEGLVGSEARLARADALINAFETALKQQSASALTRLTQLPFRKELMAEIEAGARRRSAEDQTDLAAAIGFERAVVEEFRATITALRTDSYAWNVKGDKLVFMNQAFLKEYQAHLARITDISKQAEAHQHLMQSKSAADLDRMRKSLNTQPPP